MNRNVGLNWLWRSLNDLGRDYLPAVAMQVSHNTSKVTKDSGNPVNQSHGAQHPTKR